MTRPYKPWSWSLGCILGLALMGCAQPTPADMGIEIVQPKDLPVPAGMDLKSRIDDGSHTLSAGEYRFVNLVYEGDSPVTQVASYMRRSMPMRNYQLVSEQRHGDNHETLVFKKGIYTVRCSVQRQQFKTRLEMKLRTHP